MKHVHILAICGYTTGGLALMAREMGYRVTGSDEDAYPPMSTLLTRKGIDWERKHEPRNLEKWGRPDLVVQGNQIRSGNSELIAAEKKGLKIISDSRFFYELTKKRRRIVVVGTHGKTTTSALLAWILTVAGKKPGFRLGATAKNFKAAVAIGKGREFVFEGDEYTTSFNDRRPKFYHFKPQVAVINNIEWDHPDVFKTREVYRRLFKNYLVDLTAKRGLIIANADDGNVLEVTKGAPCRVVTFGLGCGEYQVREIKHTKLKTSFNLYRGANLLGRLEMKLVGEHNVRNALAAMTFAVEQGIDLEIIRKALRTFKGVSRRFEIVGRVAGVTVVDDYAHHPTKVRETIAAARARYPDSRLFTVYVPHTYSRTKALFSDYLTAFKGADLVIVGEIEPARERHLEKLVSSKELVTAVSRKQANVFYIPEPSAVIEFLMGRLRPGDVVLCMSVRGFDDLAEKLVAKLKQDRIRSKIIRRSAD